MTAPRPLRLGMVGGGQGAFIGAVHRMAAALDGNFALTAGALSSTPEKSRVSGHDLGLADDRNYPDWQAMIAGEAARPVDERIDAVSIVTPNVMHFPVAQAALEAGFHVICDKPMVMTPDEAQTLAATVNESGLVFCVTYNYTGYPMVKQARAMVADGAIGDVRKVIVEYTQGWLAEKLEDTGQKQAEWRTDPARTGVGGAIGDIGSHAENLVAYVTGEPIADVCADLTSFVPGRPVDDDANVLVRFASGAKGVLVASQVCIGGLNDLRLRVWGTTGGLAWHQEHPEQLVVTGDGPDRIYHRGTGGLDPSAERASRLPAGHPEAFIEAFANVYAGAARAIRGEADPDHPTVEDGARGVRFIHAVVESSAAGQAWTAVG